MMPPTDAALEARLFPEAGTKQGYRRHGEPDWASLHRELKRKHFWPNGHIHETTIRVPPSYVPSLFRALVFSFTRSSNAGVV
jgi:transposase